MSNRTMVIGAAVAGLLITRSGTQAAARGARPSHARSRIVRASPGRRSLPGPPGSEAAIAMTYATTATGMSEAGVAAGPLDEEFAFLLQQFPMYHQREHHRLNIAVRYRYAPGITNAQYPDYQWLMRDIGQFLTHYPGQMTYWEIVNKQMTQMLLKKYPMLATITSVIEVGPTRSLPHVRLCIVTRSRSGTQ
jgi:hypothetical protein